MNSSTNISENIVPGWVYVEQVAFSGIIAIIGIPGNILIIIVFAYSSEKTTTDYMVFSMAISDLLGSAVCTSFNLLRHIPALWSTIGSKWYCRAYDFFAVYTGVISSWILGMVAIDRYLKVCRPFSKLFTISRVKTLCIIVYITVTVYLMPSFAIERFDYSTGACIINDPISVWSIFIYIISFLCCLSYIVTAIAYIRVAVALYIRLKIKHKRDNRTGEIRGGNKDKNRAEQVEISSSTANTIHLENSDVIVKIQTSIIDSYLNGKSSKGRHMDGLLQEQRKVNRTTKIMFLITIINVSSFVFVFIGNSLVGHQLYLPADVREAIGRTVRTSYMVSYISNPLLYVMMSSRFRERVKTLFPKLRKL